jgi:hypothetical protein
MNPMKDAWIFLKEEKDLNLLQRLRQQRQQASLNPKECPCGSGLRSLEVGYFYPNEVRCKLCHRRKMEEYMQSNMPQIEQGLDQQGYSMNDPNAFPQQQQFQTQNQ